MGDKVYWLYRELQRILHEHPDIERVGVKTNEYTPIDNRAKRESAYLEGVVLLFFPPSGYSGQCESLCFAGDSQFQMSRTMLTRD